MCGRFALFEEWDSLQAFFGVYAAFDYSPRFNIAPSNDVVCLMANGDDGFAWQYMHWGIRPNWAKQPSQLLINARTETASQKSTFKHILKTQRCCVVASGYFEWQRRELAKQPYYIYQHARQPFAMAALYSEQLDREGRLSRSCVLLTAQAYVDLASIHQRMPVRVPEAWMASWLSAAPLQQDYLGRLLAAQTHDFEFSPVSSYVNSPSHDGPLCVQPNVA